MMTQQGLHAGSVARGGRNCSAAPGTWCAERGPRSRYHIFSRKNREDALSHPRVWLTLMPAYAGRRLSSHLAALASGRCSAWFCK